VDRWTNQLGKTYIDRPVEIVEIQLEGLRDGLKVEVQGFVEEGRKIKRFHRFHRSERVDENEVPPVPVRRHTQYPANFPDDDDEDKTAFEGSPETIPKVMVDRREPSLGFPNRALTDPETLSKALVSLSNSAAPSPSLPSVIFRPRKRVIVPTSDVNIDLERRALANMILACSKLTGRTWMGSRGPGGKGQGQSIASESSGGTRHRRRLRDWRILVQLSLAVHHCRGRLFQNPNQVKKCQRAMRLIGEARV
jgi:hypothetical protein